MPETIVNPPPKYLSCDEVVRVLNHGGKFRRSDYHYYAIGRNERAQIHVIDRIIASGHGKREAGYVVGTTLFVDELLPEHQREE